MATCNTALKDIRVLKATIQLSNKQSKGKGSIFQGSIMQCDYWHCKYFWFILTFI